MALESFCNQFQSFLTRNLLNEQNVAVANAQSILAQEKTESMTYEHAIEVMKHVSECFNDSPSQVKREVRRIVRSENKKIQAITQEMLPAAAATTSSTSRKRIAELETTSSKKEKLDDRLMRRSQSLESQILYMHQKEIRPTSVDDAIFILQKRMENVLKRFKEEKESAQIPSKDISTIQKHVQKNIEHYIQEIKTK